MGSNEARTDLGRPVAEKTTTSGLPNTGLTLTVTSVFPAAPSVVLGLSTEMAKSLSMTMALAVALRVTPAAVACTANGTSPMGADASAATVTVAAWPGLTCDGVTVADTPGPSCCGTASWMARAAALDRSAAVETVKVVVPPRTTEPGSADIHTAKSGAVAQPGSWKVATRVRQFLAPSNGMYWEVYQNVQSSDGSTDRLL